MAASADGEMSTEYASGWWNVTAASLLLFDWPAPIPLLCRPPCAMRSTVVPKATPTKPPNFVLPSWPGKLPPATPATSVHPPLLSRFWDSLIAAWQPTRSLATHPLGVSQSRGSLRIKKDAVDRVLVLGVHGWFPDSSIIKAFSGSVIGTSEYFAAKMSQAVRERMPQLDPKNVNEIALKGQGTVEDRYDQIMRDPFRGSPESAEKSGSRRKGRRSPANPKIRINTQNGNPKVPDSSTSPSPANESSSAGSSSGSRSSYTSSLLSFASSSVSAISSAATFSAHAAANTIASAASLSPIPPPLRRDGKEVEEIQAQAVLEKENDRLEDIKEQDTRVSESEDLNIQQQEHSFIGKDEAVKDEAIADAPSIQDVAFTSKDDIGKDTVDATGQNDAYQQDEDQASTSPPTNPSTSNLDLVKSADAIVVSAHSQGVPVTIMLLARLIQEGVIDPTQTRICIMAMAGIIHGPFPGLQSSLIVKYIESDPARQLFAFNDGASSVSRRLAASLHYILEHGVRILACGSWYDQVVPLYSACFHGYSHPGIYRVFPQQDLIRALKAIHIEGADYIPDFMSHLVVFALKLRNMGYDDHGLVVHLSDMIAGNVYGFGTQGHSTIYEEKETYKLAIDWMLQSTLIWEPYQGGAGDEDGEGSFDRLFLPPNECRAGPMSGHASRKPFSAPTRLNSYYLPWIMNELFHDEGIKGHPVLRADLDELVRMFSQWEPTNKVLKELKHILEPLKSKL